ncbi:MAG: adenylyl-sulfate kinase, partial [Bdellovibrionales bacterium]
SEQNCTIKQIKYTVDVENMQHIAADTLKLNDIGVCDLYLNKKTAYDRFENHSDLGAFILIDRHTNQTIAMGMIEYAMSRSFNITEQHLTISRKQRALQKSQKPCTFWMTGLSGSGKSTIANALEQALFEKGFHTIILDGDNVRHGLNKDLGFTEHQRAENIRRIAEVSKLMMDAGLIVIVSFISPFEAEREMAKRIIGEEDFVEVYIDAPLEVAEKRDVKGLYKKARAGKIPNFTGISSPYEPPRTPDLRLRTEKATVEENAQEIISYIKEKGLLREGD